MKHTSREDPGFYNLLALDRTRKLDAPDVLDGLNGSLMSEDLRSGSRTFVLELPPGYRGRTDAQVASLEFFLLRGDLSMNGETVGASGYVHVPQLCGGAELYSERGALALAF